MKPFRISVFFGSAGSRNRADAFATVPLRICETDTPGTRFEQAPPSSQASLRYEMAHTATLPSRESALSLTAVSRYRLRSFERRRERRTAY